MYGYYFITPYVSDASPIAYGPSIFDYTGQLIWYGNESVEVRGQDLHVCDFDDHGVGLHICFNDALPVAQPGHSSGNIRFFNTSYQEVNTDFEAANGLVAPDMHELNTPNAGNGTYMFQDVYQSTPKDLTAWNGPADGYVWNGCFQQIDLNSHDVTFQWCSLDHVILDETYTFLQQTPDAYHNVISGNGSQEEPWDYAHINAIDLTATGDFLISLRHTHTIYKVAGPETQSGKTPGDVIWRLGGKMSDFTLDDFAFAWQHDVRSIGTSPTTDDLTLFDNAADDGSNISETSSGKVIHVDTTSGTANLTMQYDAPGPLLSSSQGSMQTLSNGNALVGWGSIPYFTEYAANGTVLFHTHFGFDGDDALQNYRAYKYPWIAIPSNPPDVFAYAQNCTGELYAYASWNGATEVRSWRFHSSQSQDTTSSSQATEQGRTGFETMANLGAYAPYVYAEALNENGTVIGTSTVETTFVPVGSLEGSCGETACEGGFVYNATTGQVCS
ncbi:MAG: hypothetical protein Q9159_002162 [Coniocarpon cinnabarinum]